MNEESRRSKTSTITTIVLVAAALGVISMFGASTVVAQSWPGPSPSPPPYGQCQHSWDPQCQPWTSQCQNSGYISPWQPPYGQNQCRNPWDRQCHYGWNWGWAPWDPGYPNQGYQSQCQPWNSQCQHNWYPNPGQPPYQQAPYWGQGQQPPYQCWGNQCCYP